MSMDDKKNCKLKQLDELRRRYSISRAQALRQEIEEQAGEIQAWFQRYYPDEPLVEFMED